MARGVLSLSLSLAVEFLFAASFFHLSLLLPGFTTGLFRGAEVCFVLSARGFGLGMAGLLASALLLSFQLGLVLGFAAFRFDARAVGLGSPFGIEFCRALGLGTEPLGFSLGLALLLLGPAVGLDLFPASKLGGFAPGIRFGLGRTRRYRARDRCRRLNRLRRLRGALKIAFAAVSPMRSGHGSFDLMAQLAGGNGAEFAPADLLNDLGARAFVDDGVIDHLNVGDINRVVNNRGVVHDRCEADRFEKTAFLDKHVTPPGNSTSVYLYAA